MFEGWRGKVIEWAIIIFLCAIVVKIFENALGLWLKALKYCPEEFGRFLGF